MNLSRAQTLLSAAAVASVSWFKRQIVYRQDSGDMRELRVVIEGRCASWERYGAGRAELSVRSWAPGRGSGIEVSLLEVGSKSHRETMLSVPDESARLLYVLLAERYGPADLAQAATRLADVAEARERAGDDATPERLRDIGDQDVAAAISAVRVQTSALAGSAA